MRETWRWFGPNDPIPLSHVKQAGATGIVTALHQVKAGDVWSLEDILERKKLIEAAGLEWSVIESIPLHNDIKTRSNRVEHYLDNYKESIRNVAKAGLTDVCYNFMPVVDWTRTNLTWELPSGRQALRFEMVDFAAYDIYILERVNAAQDYSEDIQKRAKTRFDTLSEGEKTKLQDTIIAGLPGGEGSYTPESIRQAIAEFVALGEDGLRENLFYFLQQIIPVAESVGVRMCIHPDDPPFSLFGLPRVVSCAEDLRKMIAAVPSKANGITLCAGSYGSRSGNDLAAMAREFGERIYFAHLRNVKREADGSFFEDDHLAGDTDMVALIDALLTEEARRSKTGSALPEIPMRPDHGHLMANEIGQTGINPGYSYAGRMKGLAELRGVIHTLKQLKTY